MPKSLIGIALVAALALTGCAQIPTDSTVQTGSDIQSGVTSDYTYYSPSGPTKGDGQTEILNGFINAFTGPQNDYLVAREFLTTSLASSWDPTQKLLIENARPTITFIGTDKATVAISVAASVDQLGHYRSFTTSHQQTFDYTFVKEAGEWRIASAPNATVLVRPVFDVLFKSYNLYFYDQQGRYLIPDLRWFPTRQSTGTRLVSALLAGPSNWLLAAAHNTFPNGTKLSLQSVPISNGTAVVDLNAVAAKATPDEMQHMLAQLNATLTQVGQVYGTVIRIEHVPQSIAELPYHLALNANAVPYVLNNGGLATLSGANPLAAVNSIVKKLGATDFAVNDQTTLVALQSPQGISLVKNYGATPDSLLIDNRPNLLRPAIDPQGYTYTFGSAKGSTLKVYSANGKAILTQGGWLAGFSHLAFAISQEGSRIAFTLRNGSSTSLYIATIIRDYQGVPISISQPQLVSSMPVVGSGLGWVGEDSIGLITAVDGMVATPTLVTIGGDIKTMTPLSSAVEVVAHSLGTTTWALDAHGSVWQLRGYSWLQVSSEIKQLHY